MLFPSIFSLSHFLKKKYPRLILHVYLKNDENNFQNLLPTYYSVILSGCIEIICCMPWVTVKSLLFLSCSIFFIILKKENKLFSCLTLLGPRQRKIAFLSLTSISLSLNNSYFSLTKIQPPQPPFFLEKNTSHFLVNAFFSVQQYQEKK